MGKCGIRSFEEERKAASRLAARFVILVVAVRSLSWKVNPLPSWKLGPTLRVSRRLSILARRPGEMRRLIEERMTPRLSSPLTSLVVDLEGQPTITLEA